MPHRQIVLDTETTGLSVDEGHKIIEMGCVEIIDRKITGQTFQRYINPEREVESAALTVHGISNEFLRDKPLFSHVSHEFMDFISGAELIIHNAPFDISFINHELKSAKQGWKAITHYSHIVDTLVLARQLHVGQRNSLDALCKRYGIDLAKRELHGALLDAHLLARVYLAMTGGQGSFFDDLHDASAMQDDQPSFVPLKKKYQLVVLQASEEESAEHERYFDK